MVAVRWFSQQKRCASCGGKPDRENPVLICPGCAAPSAIISTSVAWGALRKGTQHRACAACEQVTIVVEPEMACEDCEQLRPDINEQLRARYRRLGPGDPADAPCVGCGHTPQGPPPSPWIHHVFGCPHCGTEISIPEESFVRGQAMHIRCGRCAKHIEIPRTIWCPKCGQRIRKEGIDAHLREISRRS
ncbi:MJ0042-type zinc finger domain-containing protein [Amycolatopsis sp. WGS_07]|uniref:MJ0042-type zinc finger domain-containing protein n=1 Tax=Amycolatopsis sp. WGS_07 TaxID=3076764 RepID=UPI003873BE48